MLGDHWVYIVLLLLVALVVFGPKRLPELGEAVGKAINEFRRASQSVGEHVQSVTSVVQPEGESPAPAQPPAAVGPTISAEVAPGRSDSAG